MHFDIKSVLLRITRVFINAINYVLSQGTGPTGFPIHFVVCSLNIFVCFVYCLNTTFPPSTIILNNDIVNLSFNYLLNIQSQLDVYCLSLRLSRNNFSVKKIVWLILNDFSPSLAKKLMRFNSDNFTLFHEKKIWQTNLFIVFVSHQRYLTLLYLLIFANHRLFGS